MMELLKESDWRRSREVVQRAALVYYFVPCCRAKPYVVKIVRRGAGYQLLRNG
jgi:hypothetical protein